MIARDLAQLGHAWLGGWQRLQEAGEAEGRPIAQAGLVAGLRLDLLQDRQDLGVRELRGDILVAVHVDHTEHAVLVGDNLVHG